MGKLDQRTKDLRSVLELMRRNMRKHDSITAEGVELIRAFFKIRDTEARRSVIELAKKLSSS